MRKKLLNYMFKDDARKLIFIHNPKCAGTSIAAMIGFGNKRTGHSPPSSIDVKEWEEYTSIVSIRNPFDRLISSWKFHTSKKYNGAWLDSVPGIKQTTLEQYFYRLAKYSAPPNVNFIKHNLSEKTADIIIRFEDLNNNNTISEILNFSTTNVLPKLNVNKENDKVYTEYFTDKKFFNDVYNFYIEDINELGYYYGQ